jgi:hypothetical protein
VRQLQPRIEFAYPCSSTTSTIQSDLLHQANAIQTEFMGRICAFYLLLILHTTSVLGRIIPRLPSMQRRSAQHILSVAKITGDSCALLDRHLRYSLAGIDVLGHLVIKALMGAETMFCHLLEIARTSTCRQQAGFPHNAPIAFPFLSLPCLPN